MRVIVYNIRACLLWGVNGLHFCNVSRRSIPLHSTAVKPCSESSKCVCNKEASLQTWGMSAGFQQAWYRPPNIKDVSGGSPSGTDLLWVPAAVSLTLALCGSSTAWLSRLWGFSREVRWSLGAEEPGTKTEEMAVCCRVKGPLKITVLLAPPETPRGCISTVLYSRDSGVCCSWRRWSLTR